MSTSNRVLRFNFKRRSDIPFEFIKKSQLPYKWYIRCGNMSENRDCTFYDGRLYEVTVNILCGEYYDTQPDVWWMGGHNIELRAVC